MRQNVVPAPDGATAGAEIHVLPVRARRRGFLVVAGIVLLLAALAAAAALYLLRARTATGYTTVAAVRQDLTQTVTASGTVNAQNTVLVGTQVSGTIQTIYVDFNSRVHRGEVLARLDPSQLQAQLKQAQGALEQARAQAVAASQQATGSQYGVAAANAVITSADANVDKAQSALKLAQQTITRDKALLSKGYLPQNQYDTDFANLIAAQTNLRAAQATAAQNRAQSSQTASQALGSGSSAQAAQAAVQAAEAIVEQDAVNLQRTVITSPVDGTVVARNVSVGQTVAASFQTPTLFTIAQDLKKMEVDIGVGEPDIGNVRPGKAVTFTVLAYPNQTFKGTVSQVRVNPTTVSNVVTYTVIVLVDNTNNQLLPGMTANTNIAVASVKNALVVPTQALTYRPQGAARPRPSGAPRSSSSAPSVASPWGQAGGAAGAVLAGTNRVLFVLRDGKPHAVPVRVDLVSGVQAAVTPLRGTLSAGDAAITGDTTSSSRVRSGSTSTGPGIGRMIH